MNEVSCQFFLKKDFKNKNATRILEASLIDYFEKDF